MLLCFLWTACSLPGFFQLERYAILPRSHDWQKLHWAKSAWRSLPKIAGTSTIKVKSWINIPYIFQNYCMFKSSTKKKKKRERTILRTYIIQISFCQFQWFIVHTHTKNLQNKIETMNRQTKQHTVAIVVMWLFF